jgi:hypothetical protein
MIRSTVSSSTRFAFVAYVLFALATNDCRAQIDTSILLDGHTYRVAGLAITTTTRSREGVASSEAKAETVAVFPCISRLLWWSYCPPADTAYTDDMDPRIAAVCLDHDRMWVGFRFYSGEGVQGVGGLGFYDLKTHKSGLLRHPALVEYSVVDLMATEDTIYAKTLEWDEGYEFYGNGLVSISKRTLEAIARVPPGGRTVLAIEDYGEPNIRYRPRIADLISAKDFLPIRLRAWYPDERAEITRLGADRFMEKTLSHDLLLCNPRSR